MSLIKVAVIYILVLGVVSVGTMLGQDKPAGKVHGYVFGDYFYKIGGTNTGSGSQFSNVPKAFQAFQLRRLYLYYDHNLSDKFAAQFLLEGNEKIMETGGRHGIFIKTAYLEWKDAIPKGSIAFGLVPTPTWSWGLSEKSWNYRSVEKTITDFRGLGGASDIGLALRGKFDSDGMFGYVAMISNGNGQKPENNKHKKYYLSLNAKPIKEVIVEGYVDYEPAGKDINKTTAKGFLAYQGEGITVGVEVVQQTQKNGPTDSTTVTPLGMSFFSWVKIVDGLNGFARVDLYNPNSKLDNVGYKETFFTVGLDWMPIKDVHLMPNVWLNSFKAKGTAPTRDADLVGRLTFFYVYK
jgi:hypothetical protein